MALESINRDHIIQAIELINKNGVQKGRHSSTYDLVYEGKLYPPKLVVSLAHKFVDGNELSPKEFEGGLNTPAFIVLENEGFEIFPKDVSITKILNKFISQSQNGDLKTKSYPKKFQDYKIKVSFGQGVAAKIPWVAIYKSPNKVSNGIYPVYLYYKKFNKLILAYGISETEEPLMEWPDMITIAKDKKKIKDWAIDSYSLKADRYGSSYIKAIYDLTRPLDSDKIQRDLTEILGVYSKLFKKYWIYAPGKDASKWGEFYEKKIMGLGWDKIGDLNQLEDRDSIRDELKLQYGFKHNPSNNSLANLDFRDTISIGDVIIAKKGKKEYLGYGIVTSDYFYDKNRDDYQKCRRVNWRSNVIKIDDDGEIVLKTLTDVTKYPDYVMRLKKLLNIDEDITKKSLSTIKSNNMQSLNTILYGPPGTGKTYKLKNEYFAKFTDTSSSLTKEEFLQELVENYSWWEVIAASLYDLKTAKVSGIIEHPILKAKVVVSSNKNVRATLWASLQAHTIQECEHVKYTNRQAPLIFNKNASSYWGIIEENLEAEAPEVIELVTKAKSFKPITAEKKRYVFTTFHQSFSYEDFIEGIKPIIYENEQKPEIGKQVIYDIKPGLFKKIVKEANEDRNNDYAIFIDEINRGNVANIFGELITLIEDDKRIDTANYIPAKLPYSNEDFGVPPNLYIIGTMNTADRSVEALDTALRRRFSFIEMNPEPAKLSAEEFKCSGIDLDALLTALNARIEKLLDKDYCIGHSYFMTIKNRQSPTEEIKTIFQNKILPLLQEYFYGDWGKILLVLGKEFVESKKDSIKFLSTESYEDFEEYDEKPIYSFTAPSNWTLDSFKTIYE